ncbi:MAG TPA: hypothetical protein VLH94_02930 [Spirochaetia bacterium]|nr:hypothetical protein [Spirochaetia bacterium]
MEIEKRYSSLVREDELMSQEELDAWEKFLAKKDNWEDDPLELLGQNRGAKKEVIITGNGPDDGDML